MVKKKKKGKEKERKDPTAPIQDLQHASGNRSFEMPLCDYCRKAGRDKTQNTQLQGAIKCTDAQCNFMVYYQSHVKMPSGRETTWQRDNGFMDLYPLMQRRGVSKKLL